MMCSGAKLPLCMALEQIDFTAGSPAENRQVRDSFPIADPDIGSGLPLHVENTAVNEVDNCKPRLAAAEASARNLQAVASDREEVTERSEIVE